MALSSTLAIGLVVGLWLMSLRIRETLNWHPRIALVIVALGWAAMGVLGALPFLLSGALGPVDALFESISGFTTTGASVITDVESLPRGLLLWRSITHWLGGVGIVVVAVAVLPVLGTAGYMLARTEAPTLGERLFPRILQTARVVMAVYVALTVIQTILLLGGGMTLFDAASHSFGTVATGGFSTRNLSIAAYESLYIEIVVISFMILSSLPLALHYLALRRPRTYWANAQLRFHLAVLGTACILVALDLWQKGLYPGLGTSLRHATFQVVSHQTTTGFATADTALWTPFAQLVLVLVMLIGGCTGSTSGAIKTFRVLVVVKVVRNQILRMGRRRAVTPIRVGEQVLDDRTVEQVGIFVVGYLAVWALGTMSLTAFGIDPVTALGAAAGTLGGVGPGLGDVGSMDNYAWMPAGAKIICIILMVLGRLEIFSLLVIFHPAFWRG